MTTVRTRCLAGCQTPRLARPLAIAALVLLTACASVDAPWPEQIIAMEQMRPLVPIHTRWLTKNVVDRSLPPVTVIAHVHVGADGRTVRSRLEQSSGNPRLDEAALQALRDARFTPYRGADGVAMPVTLVALLHYPQERAADKGLSTNR